MSFSKSIFNLSAVINNNELLVRFKRSSSNLASLFLFTFFQMDRCPQRMPLQEKHGTEGL